jgi:hypothetical protein
LDYALTSEKHLTHDPYRASNHDESNQIKSSNLMNWRLHKIPLSSFSTSAKLSEMMQSFAKKISK